MSDCLDIPKVLEPCEAAERTPYVFTVGGREVVLPSFSIFRTGLGHPLFETELNYKTVVDWWRAFLPTDDQMRLERLLRRKDEANILHEFCNYFMPIGANLEIHGYNVEIYLNKADYKSTWTSVRLLGVEISRTKLQ